MGYSTVPGEYPGITPKISGVQKERKILSMSHILAGHNMSTHNNTLANLCRGVGERVLFTDSKLTLPIKPLEGIFEEKLASYRDQLVKTVGFQSSVTYEEFVDYYKGPRKLVYQRAVDSLRFVSVRPRDARLKTFVKAEKINRSLKFDPVPRVIQPRDPRYNVEVGRYLRPIEKKVYSAINELFGTPTIMSEFNAYSQAQVIKDKWDQFHRPVCIGLDASRFDQHVSEQALKFEHKLYNKVYRSKLLKYLLNLQLVNKGLAVASDGSFQYSNRGGRMSGDMNTSLGNKIIMCLMAKRYIDEQSFKIEFVNNGDDCLMIFDSKYLSKLDGMPLFFKDYGFNIITEPPVFEVEQIEFCQSKPVCVNGIWRMVRNTRTCLSKDVTCVSLGHDERQYRCWLRDVAMCGKAVAGDVPVLGAFYNMLHRLGLDGKYSTGAHKEYTWYYQASKNATLRNIAVDDYGRYSYWLSTGISPDQQVEIEKYFNSAVWGANERQLIIDLALIIDG